MTSKNWAMRSERKYLSRLTRSLSLSPTSKRSWLSPWACRCSMSIRAAVSASRSTKAIFQRCTKLRHEHLFSFREKANKGGTMSTAGTGYAINNIQIQAGNLLPKISGICALFTLLACLASSLHAQSYRGSIRGFVHDQSGASIVGAKVGATDLANGYARESATELDGGYVLPELPAGHYDVTAEMKGFSI